MTTKRYLEQIARIETLIRNKRIELEKMEDLCGQSAVQTDGERVQTSNIGDPTGRFGTELVALEKQILRWFRKRADIISQIDSMDNPKTYSVLTLRYVRQMTVYDMAEEMDVSDRQVTNLLNIAYKEFEEKYGQLYLDSCKNPEYSDNS